MAVLGVLGGMGPLASTEFLKTLYEANTRPLEQDMPRVLLDSDPAFPDRTAVIGGPLERDMAERIGARLTDLVARGATRLVMSCVTAHHFLPLVADDVRERLVSLVDVAHAELAAREGRFLLLCTAGTRRARLFERDPRWERVRDGVALPSPADQDLVHRMVYRMKREGAVPEVAPMVERLRERYGCTGVILGCTEFHLVSAGLRFAYGEAGVVDPLLAVARDLPGLFELSSLPRREVLQHA